MSVKRITLFLYKREIKMDKQEKYFDWRIENLDEDFTFRMVERGNIIAEDDFGNKNLNPVLFKK